MAKIVKMTWSGVVSNNPISISGRTAGSTTNVVH
jgi:hypothetical protein